MRLDKARIAPVALDALDADQKDALGPMLEQGRVINIFRTMARKPKALKRFLEWGGYILSRRNSLPPREREIAILRTGWNCRSGYEWTQHVPIGIRAGLTEAEVAAIKAGAGDPSWGEADRAILAAVDDLTRDFFISDHAWTAVRAHWSEEQAMDLVYTVGQYTQVSMALNSFGVQLDEGQVLDPELKVGA